MNSYPDHTRYVDIHTHNPNRVEGVTAIYNLNLSDFVKDNISGPVSVGLHPWHIGHFEHLNALHPLLVEAALSDGVIAIGETGLDKICSASMALQEDVFREHINISEEAGMPLIIHCVRAFQEISRIRAITGATQPWILHGFNSSPEMALEMTSMGFYISVGERLLRNLQKSRDILQSVPISNIFAETDDDARSIMDIYDQMAEISGHSVKELKEFLTQNFSNVFGR